MAKRYRRITKKELKKDKLLEKGIRASIYIRKHNKKIGIITGSILLIAIGGLIFRGNVQSRQKQAEFELREAITLYSTRNLQEALLRFEDISRIYPNTQAGIASLYWLSNIYYFQGRYAEARKYFKKYIKKGKNRLLLQSSLLGIADTYMQENNYFSALKKYKELVTRFPNSLLVPKALLQSIRCYQYLNQPTQACSTLKQLTQSYPQSPYTKRAQCLIRYIM
jgi:TolA-binding protein